MGVEKVIISSIKFSNNWFSISDNLGREISVGTVDKKTNNPVNPKLTKTLQASNAGDEVEIDIREWKNSDNEIKLFGNDPKSSGSGFGGSNKSFTPADKSFQSALAAAQAASTLLSLGKENNFEKWNETFEKIHAAILSKKSA